MLTVVTTPLEHSGQDRLRPRKALHSCHGAGRPGISSGIATPKAELAAVVRAYLFRYKDEPDDPTCLCRFGSPRWLEGLAGLAGMAWLAGFGRWAGLAR